MPLHNFKVVEKPGVSQVVAVVAWKSLQRFLAWGGSFWNQALQTKYAMPFWLIHCRHGVLGSLNQGSQHHFAQQVVCFSAQLRDDLVNAGVTHSYRTSTAN